MISTGGLLDWLMIAGLAVAVGRLAAARRRLRRYRRGRRGPRGLG
jgi:hypothetical protein